MKKLLLPLAGIAAALAITVGGLAGAGTKASPVAAVDVPTATPTTNPGPPPYPLRAEVACSPLTSTRVSSAPIGSEQKCRVRVSNMSATETITGITYVRDTPNTLTSRVQYNGPAISCDLSGCDPCDLAPGERVIVLEFSTFNAARALTSVTATGTMGEWSLSASGTEKYNLQ